MPEFIPRSKEAIQLATRLEQAGVIKRLRDIPEVIRVIDRWLIDNA